MRQKGDDISDASLLRFTDSMIHRGPDSRGVWRDSKAGVAFGNRRLAGIDLTDRGAQPMSYANGRYVITYNGTIYNYIEVRAELKEKGYTFVSDCDTEVILAAYAAWGQECQYKFNGDWAFALWDRDEKMLFISRDRFGVKPFYYLQLPTGIAFASELKAFLAVPEFHWEFDEELIAETLTNINGLEGTQWTLLKGAKRLRGGHCMTIRAGQAPVIQKWWETHQHLPQIAASFTDQAEEFRELFLDSCKLRLRSSRPIVSNLSGGLDSSSVTSAMASIRSAQGLPASEQRAYVAKFVGTNQDEAQYAKAVAEYHGISPVYLDINVDEILGSVEDLIWHYEDIYWVLPVGQWLILKEMVAREGLVVTLDGGGGDDILSSLSFFILDEMQRCLLRGDLQRFRELRGVVESMAGGNDSIRTNFYFLLKRMLLQTKIGRKGLVPMLNEWMPVSAEHFLKYPIKNSRLYDDFMSRQVPGLTPLNRAHYWWFHNTGVPTIDRTYDRSATAHGVEVRTPFLDWRVVTYAFALPDESKVGGGFNKRILREAMKGYMPDSVRLRTSKVGFSSPMESWMRGPLRPWLLDAVSSQEFLQSSIWNGPRVQRFILDSIKRQAWDQLPRMWPFIQAYYLMQTFKKRSA